MLPRAAALEGVVQDKAFLRLLALCLLPPTLVQEYAGRSYEDFLEDGCSVGLFLDSVVCIVRQLGELHERHVVHNDVEEQ